MKTNDYMNSACTNSAPMDSISRPITIFVSAGEPSGDHHGARLVRAFYSRLGEDRLRVTGFGGPLMRAVGQEQLTDLTEFTVFGIVRVLRHLRTFTRLLGEAEKVFSSPEHRPDAVVVIDYPGFHWELAARAKRYGIPVFYFISPQIWAWAPWRVRRMRRLIDHVFCSLPFEEPWLRRHGCAATYVGNPFFDVWNERTQEQINTDEDVHTDEDEFMHHSGPIVTILPGSRNQEVSQNTDVFLRAAQRIRESVPDVRFAVAAFREDQATMIRERISELNVTENSGKSSEKTLPIRVFVGRTPELIASATACMACSGSVSLELLAAHRPTVIHYRIGRIAYRVQKHLRRTRYITLVNLLAAENFESSDRSPYDPDDPKDASVLFPEYLVCRDASDPIAKHIVHWLTDRVVYDTLVAKLAVLHAKVVAPAAADHAAAAIIDRIANKRGLVS